LNRPRKDDLPRSDSEEPSVVSEDDSDFDDNISEEFDEIMNDTTRERQYSKADENFLRKHRESFEVTDSHV